MARYLVRRGGISVVVLLGVSIIAFLMLHYIAGSPGRAILGFHASARAVAGFNRSHGFDRPLPVQYGAYLWQVVHGNLGFSYKLDQSVEALLAENAGRTAMLVAAALVIAIVIAVPLGIFQAVKRGSIADNLLTTGAFATYSMPSFFIAFILIELFALRWHLFPAEASQSSSPFVVFTDPRAMCLPIATLAAISVALFSRYQRSAALDQLAQDYVKVARAKGLSERMVLTRHLLRNACLPIITLVGLSLPLLLAGNLVVEEVFNYPGLGLLFFRALGNDDYPVLLGYVLVTGALTVIGNFAADIAMSVADPRISRT